MVFFGVQFSPAVIKIIKNKTKQTNETSNDNCESCKENQSNYAYIFVIASFNLVFLGIFYAMRYFLHMVKDFYALVFLG